MTEFVEFTNKLSMLTVKLKVEVPLTSVCTFPRSPTCLMRSVRSPWVTFVGLKWVPVELQPNEKLADWLINESRIEYVPAWVKRNAHALNMHSSEDIFIESFECARYGNIWIKGCLCKSDIADVYRMIEEFCNSLEKIASSWESMWKKIKTYTVWTLSKSQTCKERYNEEYQKIRHCWRCDSEVRMLVILYACRVWICFSGLRLS